MYSYSVSALTVIGKKQGLRSSWHACHWPTRICMSGVEKKGAGFLFKHAKALNKKEVHLLSYNSTLLSQKNHLRLLKL